MKVRAKVAPSIDPKFSSYGLRIDRSRIHGWGVYAVERIPPGRKVIEYTGERLTVHRSLARLRRTCLKPRTRRLTMIKLDRYWRIDAAFGGSGAEYINHSCEPNLKVRRIRGHVLLFSRRQICPAEELTFDYRLHPKTFRIACQCGAANCRGTVNRVETRAPRSQSRERRKRRWQRKRARSA